MKTESDFYLCVNSVKGTWGYYPNKNLDHLEITTGLMLLGDKVQVLHANYDGVTVMNFRNNFYTRITPGELDRYFVPIKIDAAKIWREVLNET